MMKRFITILLCAIICCPTFAKNKALLIGIGRYKTDSGWRDISSTNDIIIIKKSLPSSFDVQTLEDSQATYENILYALESLISYAEEGDTILFHFSGHGQQMVALDSDEPDGLDEALVPYDAPNHKNDSYNGERHLKDNELGEYIDGLRKQVGVTGFVIICLDACYSDSMNRGEGSNSIICRGGADIFGIDNLSQAEVATIYKKRICDENIWFDKGNGLSDIVVLSACKSYQTNHEIKKNGVGYGPLSYAIAESFSGKEHLNIQEWLDKVLSIMHYEAYEQEPVIRTTLEYQNPPKEIIVDSVDSAKNNDEQKDILDGITSPDYVLIPFIVLLFFGVVIFIFIVIKYGKRNK